MTQRSVALNENHYTIIEMTYMIHTLTLKNANIDLK